MKTRTFDCVIVDGLVPSCLTFDGPKKGFSEEARLTAGLSFEVGK